MSALFTEYDAEYDESAGRGVTADDVQDALATVMQYGDEATVADVLAEATGDDQVGVARVSTYAQAGVLTRDAGLVVELADGSEFQITIIRSR